MLRVMDRYIGKQIIASTIFGVAVLSILLLMGNLFKELRPLLVEDRASIGLVGKFILNVLPFSLIFTLPWGFLVAVLLVFGRLSGSNELISMRMAGVGLFRIALPVYVIGALLCGLCLWLNISMAPQAKNTMKTVLYQAVQENPNALLAPGVVQAPLDGQKIFIASREGDTIKGLHLYYLNEKRTDFPVTQVYAREAKLKINNETKQISLKLTDAYVDAINSEEEQTMPQIGYFEPLIFDFSSEKKRKRKPNTLTNTEIKETLQENKDLPKEQIYKLKNEVSRRYSFSLSCLALAIVAVPLGINGRRKETSTGLALSILVGLGYFLFFMVADEYNDKAGSTALILYWVPNILCLILGVHMFFRARRK